MSRGVAGRCPPVFGLLQVKLAAVLVLTLGGSLSMVAVASHATAASNNAVTYQGLGFDTCSAPSVSQMSAWLSSPYRSIGINIGGVNRTCAQPDLSASWVSQVQGHGWRLAPRYQGLQAPCVIQQSEAKIDPGMARVEGTQAADDAVNQATSIGLGQGAPIFYDMEPYGSGCSTSVLTFLGAWTLELHRMGYLAGLFGFDGSVVADESTVWGSNNQVDELWLADPNGTPNTFNDPAVANTDWADHQRAHQFLANQSQSYGGVTLTIDEDIADAMLVGQCGPQSPSCLTPIAQHYLDLGGGSSVLGEPLGREKVAPDGIGRYQYFTWGEEVWSPYTNTHEVHGAIYVRYASLASIDGVLGYPLDDESSAPDGVGRLSHFQRGSIYWTAATGPWEVQGTIESHWEKLGGVQSIEGYPLSNESPTPDGLGRYNHFQNGSVYWTSGTGAWEVHGAIRAHWAQLGWERSPVGYPIRDETAAPGGLGRYNQFQNGYIVWSPATGPWEVQGAIANHYAALGLTGSVEGYAVTDESPTPDGIGRYNHFQNGSIYWTSGTGAWEVHGVIRAYWAQLGWERSPVGYPVSDETRAPDGVGRYNQFQNGYIVWSPATGPREVQGAIANHYASLGLTGSFLGYPIGGETAVGDGVGRFSWFQGGIVFWSGGAGAWSVKGAIASTYLSLGGPFSRLGYPTSDETPTSYGARSAFQGGYIDWSRTNGAVNVVYTVPAVVAFAASQVGYTDVPADTFCNKYTSYWGVGQGCGNGLNAEEWCADFAAWVWRKSGAQFTYGWGFGDLNAGAVSFYRYAVAHGTWHPAGSGYVPRPGDAVVFGLDPSGTIADHVAIVIGFTPGAAGPDAVNGDWWDSGFGMVAAAANETTATGTDGVSGYASPIGAG
jgi:uncharacterized protein with LGFP repeats